MKPKYEVENQSKLLKNIGHVDANKIVGPDLRQGKSGLEVISHTGPVDNKQSGAIKATLSKVWKRRDQKGHERNLRNEIKDETSGGKRPIEDCFRHYNMLVVSSIRRAGGLLLLWKKECNLRIQNFSRNHINFIVKEDNGNSWR
ncbi:hypothetical protein Tco_1144511, partial [Tanacetum coccineum]